MDDHSGTDYSCFSRVSACFALSVIYVGSLYVWNSSQEWDHPDAIKRRFVSIFFMSLISPAFTYYYIPDTVLMQDSLLQLLGIRRAGIVEAMTWPLLLTMILFLGPIAMKLLALFYEFSRTPGTIKKTWVPDIFNLVFLKNQLVAPFSEELTFRACMLPLLLQCLRPITAIIFSPLLFGVAHFHHMRQLLKKGLPFKNAFFISCFQIFYTTLFGAYSAFLFVRTGHLIAPFIIHSFCNYMGFPDFAELFSYKQPHRAILMGLFVLGLSGWAVLLLPMTQPSIYQNKLYWIQEPPFQNFTGTTIQS